MAELKLKDLQYLVALADTRHFGKAAAKCFVSQPTLSAQLKKLEDYLGAPLIERQPKNVTLTEVASRVEECGACRATASTRSSISRGTAAIRWRAICASP